MEPAQVVKQLAAPQHGKPGYHRRSAVVHLYCSQIGLARTIYIRCVYGTFGREFTIYTVIYGVYIRFWPTLLTNDAGQQAEQVANDKRNQGGA
jgi:hypothetical protein